MSPVPLHVSGNNSTWCVPPEGCHIKLILLQLGNGWADCVEIWYVVRCPLVMHFTKGIGEMPLSARAHVHTALLYLRNGSTDCVQIW